MEFLFSLLPRMVTLHNMPSQTFPVPSVSMCLCVLYLGKEELLLSLLGLLAFWSQRWQMAALLGLFGIPCHA